MAAKKNAIPAAMLRQKKRKLNRGPSRHSSVRRRPRDRRRFRLELASASSPAGAAAGGPTEEPAGATSCRERLREPWRRRRRSRGAAPGPSRATSLVPEPPSGEAGPTPCTWLEPGSSFAAEGTSGVGAPVSSAERGREVLRLRRRRRRLRGGSPSASARDKSASLPRSFRLSRTDRHQRASNDSRLRRWPRSRDAKGTSGPASRERGWRRSAMRMGPARGETADPAHRAAGRWQEKRVNPRRKMHLEHRHSLG